jgi:hypothetical protein
MAPTNETGICIGGGCILVCTTDANCPNGRGCVVGDPADGRNVCQP